MLGYEPAQYRDKNIAEGIWRTVHLLSKTMKYQLSELIDLARLQRLMESLHLATGLKHALIDNVGDVLTAAGWEPVCERFHRRHPGTFARCRSNDRYLFDNVANACRLGRQCPNGLFDYAMPVCIDGEHVASLFTGQLLHDPPDLDFFRKQANTFGFDEEAYLAAVRSVPVVPREQMSALLDFFGELAQTLGEQGLVHLRQLETQEELRRLNATLLERIKQRTAEVSAANLRLSKRINVHQQMEAALRQEKHFFDDLISSLPGMFYVLDDEGRFVRWNKRLSEITGYADEDVAGMPASRIFPAEVHALLQERIQAVFATGESELEAPLLKRDGQQVLHYFTGRRTIIDGKPFLVGLGIDISERHAAELRHKESEDKLRSLYELSPLGITMTDMAGRYVEFNEAFQDICGYSAEELKQLDFWKLTPEQYHEAHRRQLDVLARDGRYGPYETEYCRADGTLVPLRMNGMIVNHSDGQRYLWSIVEDISIYKHHQAELQRLAHFDSLTGIPNRTLLAERLSQATAAAAGSGSLLAVCYLDLDGFKPINDRFGHDAGDKVLIEVANRLHGFLRRSDTVARIGGDEFVLLVELDHIEDCEPVLDRLLHAVNAPFVLCDQEQVVSASLGATIFPVDNVDGDTLIRHADQAMYLAKQSGKNRYQLFDPERDRRVRARLEQIAGVWTALRNDEFVLYYQPKVNMRTGSVYGAEALLRWQHPERGLLAPGEFLRALEATDGIVALGDWVLDNALRQAVAWQREGIDINISVNIAARHLLRQDFVSRLQAHLAAYPDFPRHRLELEVLETAALEDIHHVAGVIQACREFGVSFALDDFGTGYSSLTYLKLLPVETVKIDQTFIRGMLGAPEDIAIVEGIIGLSKVFGHRVVAEGVETAAHGVALLGLGCDLAQGYGVARPMPASDFPAWVRTWQPDESWH